MSKSSPGNAFGPGGQGGRAFGSGFNGGFGSGGSGPSGRNARNGYGRPDAHYVIPYRPHRDWKWQLVLCFWRWSIELLVLGALSALVVAVHHRTGRPVGWAVILLTGTVLVPLVHPRTRFIVAGLFWCLLVRHRLRTFFIEGRIFNTSGRLPWIVAFRPTVVGERCWVWLMPGLSIADVENRSEDIAVACWARTVRVERHKRNASLVRVDVIRRDPLTAGDGLVPSVLIPTSPDTTAAGPTGDDASTASSSGLDLPSTVIDLRAHLEAMNGVNGSKPATKKSTDRSSDRPDRSDRSSNRAGAQANGQASTSNGNAVGPVVTGRGGEDISDYL